VRPDGPAGPGRGPRHRRRLRGRPGRTPGGRRRARAPGVRPAAAGAGDLLPGLDAGAADPAGGGVLGGHRHPDSL
ncbi:MAG: hypothetical protein AVDCRST_MAG66-1776, partial [uncultured Pseudonocardia sp.]